MPLAATGESDKGPMTGFAFERNTLLSDVLPSPCIYDSSTTTTTMTLFARRLINTVPYHASRASIARLLLLVLTCVCVVLCSSACFAITFLFRIVVFCLGMFCFVSICFNFAFCFVVFWFGPHAAVLLQD